MRISVSMGAGWMREVGGRGIVVRGLGSGYWVFWGRRGKGEWSVGGKRVI